LKERIKMNDDDGFEKNIYCWDGCMDKDTNWNAIMQPIDWGGEDCIFCPECYKIWDLDYKQIPPATPHWARKAHAARMALFSEGKEQTGAEVDELAGKYMYCRDACKEKDTGWNAIMEPIVIGDEDCMLCPECHKVWDQSYRQIPPEVVATMAVIERHRKEKEQNPQDYWPDDDIQGGN
jgi:ferredoxin